MNSVKLPLVVIDDRVHPGYAQLLSQRLQIPLLSAMPEPEQARFRLQPEPDALSLVMTGAGAPGPVKADFASPSLSYRVRDAVQQQDISRAVGVKPGFRPRIVDATAGLGRDGFLLAGLGCHVTLVEADPVIHVLLEDAIRRAAISGQAMLCEAVDRMTLILGNFCQLAASLEPVDVVYLDPMFPKRGKAARVKKEMYVLQQYFMAANPVTGTEQELLHAALSLALRRVVVKRARLAQPLAGLTPHHSLTGSSSRYDVYLRT